MLGATTGTTMKTIITKDITSAMRRPPKASRTTATATTRGAALARPCRKRATSRVSKLVGDEAAEGGEGIDGEADEEHGLAAEPVAQGSVEELAEGEADDVARQDELLAVGVGDAELLAHLRQRREHHVDRERGQRHQRRDQRDELGETRQGPRRRGGGGLGHGRGVRGWDRPGCYSARAGADQGGGPRKAADSRPAPPSLPGAPRPLRGGGRGANTCAWLQRNHGGRGRAAGIPRADSRVEAQKVEKTFGSGASAFRALDDVSLEIRSNEFFTLPGPSGCGKMTLLRLIAGFEHPTRGRILLDGAASLDCRRGDR